MARNKRKIDGWVVLDKPLTMTSTQAVGSLDYSLLQSAEAGKQP